MGSDGGQTISINLGSDLDQISVAGASEVEKLLTQRKLNQAYNEAEKLFKRFPHKCRVRIIYGLAALLTGRQSEADKMLEFIATLPVEEAPAIYLFWADMLFENGRTESAWGLCSKALLLETITPDHMRRCANIAMATRIPGRLSDVLDHWAKQFPDDENIALFHAGFLLRKGHLEDAVVMVRNAMEGERSFGAAFNMLADMDISLITNGDMKKAQEFRRSGSGTDLDRAFIGFALGKKLEREGDYDRAFEEYIRGNGALRAYFDKTGKIYLTESQAASHEMLKKLTGLFPWTQSKTRKGAKTPQPIFIVGMPSSGTSLMEQILSMHKNIRACGERTAMNEVMKPVLKARKEGRWQDGIPRGERVKLQEIYLSGIKDEIAGYDSFTDKMPGNFIFIGLISEIFPEAKILLMKRDPMDNCLSIYCRPFNLGFFYSTDLKSIGTSYRQSMALINHWKERFGEKILEVSYESLVDDQEGICRGVLEFCGLPWDKKCLEFHDSKHPVFTLSAAQVRRPLFKTSVGRWKKFEKHLGSLKDALDC